MIPGGLPGSSELSKLVAVWQFVSFTFTRKTCWSEIWWSAANWRVIYIVTCVFGPVSAIEGVPGVPGGKCRACFLGPETMSWGTELWVSTRNSKLESSYHPVVSRFPTSAKILPRRRAFGVKLIGFRETTTSLKYWEWSGEVLDYTRPPKTSSPGYGRAFSVGSPGPSLIPSHLRILNPYSSNPPSLSTRSIRNLQFSFRRSQNPVRCGGTTQTQRVLHTYQERRVSVTHFKQTGSVNCHINETETAD